MAVSGTHELPAVAARPVLVAAFGILRRRFRLVAGAGVVVFGASAGVDLLVDVVDDRSGSNPGLVVVVLMAASLAMFGSTFFAGFLDRIVAEEERGAPRQPLGRLLRKLPYVRLIAADLLLTLGAIVLAAALVVPGLVFYTFFCLVGPVIVMDDRKVLAAFRRSARLVRTRFWLTLLLVTAPVTVEEDVVHGIVELANNIGPVAVFLLNTVAGAAVGTIVALVEVTLAHRLDMRVPDDTR